MAKSVGMGQFARRMKVIAHTVIENAERAVRQSALVADQVAVMETPVDTARARANWITSIGSPVSREEDPPVAGDAGASATKALLQGASVISRWKVGQGSIFITNNVDYIIPLDEGSSQQSPEGMTKPALAAAQQVLRRAKLLKGV